MRPTYLVVEDDLIDTELLCKRLERFNPEFICVTTAKAGLAALKQSLVQAVFVNLKLGRNRTAGIDFIIHCRQLTLDMPIFVVTGAEEERIRVMALSAGATGFFSKEFDAADERVVMNILQMRAAAFEKGRAMKHWRTSLSGACTATGMALFGGPLALSATKFEVPSEMSQFCIWGGLILTVAGIFFGQLFAADKRHLDRHLEQCKPTNKEP